MKQGLLVVAMCLLLALVPSTIGDNEVQLSKRGEYCGLEWCSYSCCFSGLSHICYDSQEYNCFHPAFGYSMLCKNSEYICFDVCYDPTTQFCAYGIVYHKPTTAAPTTQKPTTASPTTAKRTTLPPTTIAPTTQRPTTLPPTTVTPTPTLPPTTQKPTATPTISASAVAVTTSRPPTIPAQLTTTTVADNVNNAIVVHYTLDAGATEYDIYRSTAPFTSISASNVSLVHSTTANATSFIDDSVTQGVSHCYAVVAKSGSSYSSNVVSSCSTVTAAIAGLTCGDTGPIAAGGKITFYASIRSGSGVSYEWVVNNGGTSPLSSYTQNFTTTVSTSTTTSAEVIASNAKGSFTCSTDFTVL